MKNTLVIILALEAAFLLEGTVRYLPGVSLRMDLVWVIALYVGFFVPYGLGLALMILIAFMQETLGGAFHGLLLFSYLSVFMLVRVASRQIFLQRKTPQVIWVTVLTTVRLLLENGILYWQGYAPVFSWETLGVNAVLNGLASLIIFPILARYIQFESPYGY